MWLQRLWLRQILPEIPASRHPPSRAKSGLCKAVTYSILPHFNFAEAGILTAADNLS
jgi:Na+/H+ antiporter NhaA